MSLLGAESRREIEIHRYPLLVYTLVLLGSLVLQAWLPRVVGRYVWFDLPLVVKSTRDELRRTQGKYD